MRKITTGCCALCQMDRVNDDTPMPILEANIKRLKTQMEANTEVGITTGNGQTAVFTIVSPGENVLEDNLIKLGFEFKHTFPRRKGYPDVGALKMYIKNL